MTRSSFSLLNWVKANAPEDEKVWRKHVLNLLAVLDTDFYRVVDRHHPDVIPLSMGGRRESAVASPVNVRPRIPRRAKEKVTAFDDQGRKVASEFWLARRLVGRATWYPNGNPAIAVGIRRRVRVGFAIEFHEEPAGAISHAEPFVAGLHHGLARQYDARGTLLMVSPFRRGTGTDFWCDQRGRLAEEHPLVDGRISGVDRWWEGDGTAIYEETNYLAGLKHGPQRHWSRTKLTPGFPHFFLNGERVSKRAYLLHAKTDPNTPSYRLADDRPQRSLPSAFIELRSEAARLAKIEQPPRRWSPS